MVLKFVILSAAKNRLILLFISPKVCHSEQREEFSNSASFVASLKWPVILSKAKNLLILLFISPKACHSEQREESSSSASFVASQNAQRPERSEDSAGIVFIVNNKQTNYIQTSKLFEFIIRTLAISWPTY